MLDCYDCKPGVCDDLELHYRFLEELVYRLDMKPLGPPIVLHAPITITQDKFGNIIKSENFPDKAGVSGWIGLITSGIQIHSIEPNHFISLDVYSCKQFKSEEVIEIAKKYFEFTNFDKIIVDRGLQYKNTV